jgi:hypothetical protein
LVTFFDKNRTEPKIITPNIYYICSSCCLAGTAKFLSN